MSDIDEEDLNSVQEEEDSDSEVMEKFLKELH